MITLEQVEKLKERANVSYEEAKEALEKTDGDLLEAMIYLEKTGKTVAQPGAFSQNYGARDFGYQNPQWNNQQAMPTNVYKPSGWQQFKIGVKTAFRWMTTNYMVVNRRGEMVVKLPFLVFCLIIFAGFWFAIPLMIIGLFFEFRYRFEGISAGKPEYNDKFTNIQQTIYQTGLDIQSSIQDSGHDKNDQNGQNTGGASGGTAS